MALWPFNMLSASPVFCNRHWPAQETHPEVAICMLLGFVCVCVCVCVCMFEIQVSFPQSLSLTQFPPWNHNNTLSLDSRMLDFLAVSPGNPLSPAQTWLWYLFSLHLSASYYSAPRVLSTWSLKALTLTNFNIGYFISLCSWISSSALDLFHQHWLRSNSNMSNLWEHYPFYS